MSLKLKGNYIDRWKTILNRGFAVTIDELKLSPRFRLSAKKAKSNLSAIKGE